MVGASVPDRASVPCLPNHEFERSAGDFRDEQAIRTRQTGAPVSFANSQRNLPQVRHSHCALSFAIAG